MEPLAHNTTNQQNIFPYMYENTLVNLDIICWNSQVWKRHISTENYSYWQWKKYRGNIVNDGSADRKFTQILSITLLGTEEHRHRILVNENPTIFLWGKKSSSEDDLLWPPWCQRLCEKFTNLKPAGNDFKLLLVALFLWSPIKVKLIESVAAGGGPVCTRKPPNKQSDGGTALGATRSTRLIQKRHKECTFVAIELIDVVMATWFS